MGDNSIWLFSFVIGVILNLLVFVMYGYINHKSIYLDFEEYMTSAPPWVNWWNENILPYGILSICFILAYGFLKSIRMKYLFFEQHTRKRIKVDESNLRLCEPPYKGNSEQDLANYLQNNVYGDYEFYNEMSNQIVYGQDELYDLVFSKKRDEIVFAERSDFENSSKTIF